MHQKGNIFLGILIGFLIAGGLFGVYYFGTSKNSKPQPQNPIDTSAPKPTPSVDETDNWKAYQSSRYGFNVKYPPNLEADDQHSAPPSVLIAPPAQPGAPGFPTYYISVIEKGSTNSSEIVYNRLSEQDIDNFYDAKIGDRILLDTAKNLKSPYSDYWYFTRLPDLVINGKTGITIENNKVWEGGKDLKDRRILLKKGNRTYIFGTFYTNPDELKIFDLFTSTIKLP